jgi:hypothetical protein
MKEDHIYRLFEVLKNEKPAVSPDEVVQWLDHSISDLPFKKNKGWIKLLYIGFGMLIMIFIFWYFQLENPKQGQDEISKLATNLSEKVVEKETSIADNLPTDGPAETKEISISEKVIQQKKEKIPEYLELPSPTIKINFPNPVEDYNNSVLLIGQTTTPLQTEIRDILFILDSLNNYGITTRYKMDEQDCYLQIYNEYAVISYRLRNQMYYASGTIHREESQEIEGNIYQVFAFQTDNRAAVSGFGTRVFFGYRQKGNKTNEVEVILFNQPWAPAKVLKAHFADTIERAKLVERSKSQE